MMNGKFTRDTYHQDAATTSILRLQSAILQFCEDSLMLFFVHCAAMSLSSEQANQETTVHDPDFRQSEKDWFTFVEKLTERLVEIDDTVPELPVKDIVSCSLHAILQDIRPLTNGTDLPHLSGCPLLQRSHPVQGAHLLLLAGRPAARPSPPRLAPSMPACCRQDAP